MAETAYLIVGLGNPGRQYETTRHNAGFMAIDHFAKTTQYQSWQVKFDGLFCRQRLFGRQVALAKPTTFMNRSGRCVAGLVRFFKIPQSNILILHDDLDLPFGRVKAVAGGGAGGHNGIRSLIKELGTNAFARVKIGIGRPARDEKGHGIPIDRYVLSNFSPEETGLLETIYSKTDTAVQLFLKQGIDRCMNQIN